ncbi:hypothetical protein M404DRAFT_142538 [Pisolithus tinctorius Marx 270]|uniref:DNA helicase n=1 Tax=Pisolithus tinctorius Marx 270 TaxID=870435 RepID=A0A0C3NUI6_PISTI|nr:hypothetical protein M404DRAFT_142538 [Pisolithus tinctorius Marx 270]
MCGDFHQFPPVAVGPTETWQQKSDLPDKVDISVGMKVMVMQNVQTDLDITNGACGTIVHIILHPDESVPRSSGLLMELTHPPPYVLVKLDCTRMSKLPELNQAMIPIEPLEKNIQIKCNGPDSHMVTHLFKCCQYLMITTYAFMDYQAQGQTIPCILVDITTPPTGGLNLFNLYVALSRISRQDTI